MTEKVDKVKKNKSIKAWVHRHLNDIYVKDAQRDGFRSRAAYKLLDIDKQDKIFAGVKRVVDLGCAPGSWSQVALQMVGEQGKVVGVDLLEIHPIYKLNFIQGDFTEQQTLDALIAAIEDKHVDLVISDMSHNLSGIKNVDQARGAYLVELVLELSKDYLKTGGNCLIKVFQGAEFESLVKMAREIFTQVLIRKPESSRSSSSETYLLCKNKKHL